MSWIFAMEAVNTYSFDWTILFGVLTIIVSILGFIITYIQVKKTILAELQKQKQQIFLNKMIDIPIRLLRLFDKLKEENYVKDNLDKEYNEIINTIIAYGSKDVVKIATKMHQFEFENENNKYSFEIFARAILIIMQLKFEITNIAINPELLYFKKTNDYFQDQDYREKLIIINNEIVNEEKLNREFLI